uniref:U1764z n=1 Tax=Mycobacterium leprae TaxID=1769 RepID=Q50010_MYCLR|nr:u1764z [Mycobacterium leprae]
MPWSLSEDDFRQVLSVNGWEITYLGTMIGQVDLGVETFGMMATRNPDMAERVRFVLDRFRVMETMADRR